MKRVLYENDTDTTREAQTVHNFMHQVNSGKGPHFFYSVGSAMLQSKLMPKACQFDRAVTVKEVSGRERIVGIIEVKFRTNSRHKYHSYMISARKVNEIIFHANMMGVPALLVVSFNGDIGVVRLAKPMIATHDLDKVIGGRSDRGDPMDKEICYLIPMTMFEWIGDEASSLAK